MKLQWVAVWALIAALVTGWAEAKPGDALGEHLMQSIAGDADAGPPTAVPGETIAYGNDPLQKLTLWRPVPAQDATGRVRGAPLVVFVHGGGWKRGDMTNATGHWKAEHYPGEGYAFASINYRLVPNATVEQQAADVAMALRALADRADALGIDRHRVVLMGHSAGAQLVALVGTDESYLRAAGLSFADVRGVIPIDGAAYDVPVQMADGPAIMQRTYAAAFGSDPARQRALSPTLQAGSPNASRFLVLHVQRPDGVRQSNALALALESAGTEVRIESFDGRGLIGHMEINRRLGDPAYPATGVVDAWLKRVFAS